MATAGSVIEAVTEENFKYWSVLVENYLRGKGIWNLVESGKIIYDNQENSIKKKDIQEKDDKAALHIIQLACGSEHLPKIIDCSTAKDAWNHLKALFEQRFNADDQQNTSDENEYGEIYGFVEEGDARGLLKCYGDLSMAITSAVFPGKRSLIHVAVISDNVAVVNVLVDQAPKEVLEMENDEGYTALALAAAFTGNIAVAEIFIDKKKGKHLMKKKAEKGVHEGLIPLVMAAKMGQKEMTSFLYFRMVKDDMLEILTENNYEHAVSLLVACINNEIFGVALDLLKIRCQNMPLAPSESDGMRPLLALAKMPSAFKSGNKYGWIRQWIYNNIKQPSSIGIYHTLRIEITWQHHESLKESSSSAVCGLIGSHSATLKTLEWCCKIVSHCAPLRIIGKLLRELLNCSLKICSGKCAPLTAHLNWSLECSGIKNIYERKLLHYQVLEILSCMSQRISGFKRSQLREASVYDAMLHASKNGIIEFIEVMSTAKKELLWESIDQSKRGIFAHAILNRRQKVFEFVHKNLKGRTKKITFSKDIFGNNLLHLAALLGPSSDLGRRFGAALQMQTELQWFKAVKECVHPTCKKETNNDGKRPREVFAKCHKELAKEAEKWAKDTANSFVIVGTLIITIIFAAAFTLPGGNDQSNGKPMFLKDNKFTAFIMTDAFSLFTASSSVLFFIWVLTARYSEKDFLFIFPCRLFFGLLTLSISVVSMFGAFSIAFFLMLKGYSVWSSTVLAVFTVVLILVPSQFSLFHQIILGSSFKPIRTEKKTHCWFLKCCHCVFSVIKFCIGF